MKIVAINAVGLVGETPKGGWTVELKPEDSVHTLIAVHTDAVKPGSRVLLADDLLATGGTALAAANLLQRLGVEILEITFLLELSFLKGREKLKGFPVRSLIVY